MIITIIIAFEDFFPDKSVLREPQCYRSIVTSLNHRSGWLLRGTTRLTYRMSPGPRVHVPTICECMCVCVCVYTF